MPVAGFGNTWGGRIEINTYEDFIEQRGFHIITHIVS